MRKNRDMLLKGITIVFVIMTIGSIIYGEKTFYKKIENSFEKASKEQKIVNSVTVDEKLTVLEEVYSEKSVQ
ncbi:hypothetical protein [Crassaminicella profunda]|uniref:hypothetical protein n=1 Tax=Crassaminicella profunda TaxID=1286698 RepID=UPI001CA63044|nr:hypothetical protein [Crassaminicella profunda]QZY55347.1 hypothetical protein K7H06_20515 [Crassaminicella profunda]